MNNSNIIKWNQIYMENTNYTSVTNNISLVSTNINSSSSSSNINSTFTTKNFNISLNFEDEPREFIFDRTDVRIIFITLYSLVFCCCFFGKFNNFLFNF